MAKKKAETKPLTAPELLAAVRRAQLAVHRGYGVRPVLKRVRVIGGKGGLVLQATNLTHALTLTVPAEVGPFDVVIDPAYAVATLASFGAEEVAVGFDDNCWSLASGPSKFWLPTFEPAEYPALPPPPDCDPVEVAAPALQTLLNRTLFAVQKDVSVQRGYMLDAVRVVRSKRRVEVAGSDGRRIAVATADGPAVGKGGPDGEWLIPADTARVLARLLPADGPVACRLGERGLGFEWPGVTFVLSVGDGRYPDFGKLMNERPEKPAGTLPVADLARAVRQARIGAADSAIRLAFAAGHLKLSSEVADAGGTTAVTLGVKVAKSVDVKLDGDYLLQMLQAVGGSSDTVDFYCTSPDRPVYFVTPGYSYLMATIHAK